MNYVKEIAVIVIAIALYDMFLKKMLVKPTA